jgi:hypothetical protein
MRYLRKTFILFSLFLTFLLSFNCKQKPKSNVYLIANQNNGKLKAEIINFQNIKSNNFLTNGVHYLKISNISDSTNYIVNYDLLEGQGGYESSIVNIKWLSNNELFIERYLNDRKQNLIYNLSNVKFSIILDNVPNFNNTN